jgi:hypothetical protein
LNRKKQTIENLPYQLQVTTQMRREKLPAFNKTSHQLVELIEAAGLKLKLSCWEMNGDIVQFYNYWDLAEDCNRLAFAELILPDVPGYAKFAKLWISETKDIVIPITAVHQEGNVESTTPGVYVRVSYELPFTVLSEFAARVEGALRPFARYSGWILGDIYWQLTGAAGAVVEMWLIPEAEAAFAAQRLSTLPWYSLIPKTPVFQILDPTPSDPNLLRFRKSSAGTAAPTK